MENKKITSHQLYTITATISMGGSVLVISSLIAGIAKQDAWISPLFTMSFGVLVMLMYYYLGSRYPSLSLIGIIKKIFGKWMGFIVSFCYVILFMTTAAEIPWYIGSYFGRIMNETPAYVIYTLFILGIVIAIYYGIEAIARASELFVLIVTILFIVFCLLLIKDFKFEYVFPILEGGLSPILKGSFFISCYITFSVINIMMIFPRYIIELPQAKKALLKGFLWSGSISFITILMSILVLGSTLTSRSAFPTLMLAEAIDVGNIMTRLEYIISFIWITTFFMIGLFFFFSTITALSELIGLKNEKTIALPMGLVILTLSGVVYPNTVYQSNWDNTVYAPLITTFGLVIPFIMMIVYMIKKRFLKAE